MHGLYAVHFDDTVDAIIGGITRHSLNTGTEVSGEPLSGSVSPKFLSLLAQNPSAAFTSRAIAQCLGECGIAGLDIGGMDTGVKLYGNLYADGGARSAGSVHRSYLIQDGIVVPMSISCEHGGQATIDYAIIATYDGTNDPIVIADSVALPAAPDDLERFTLGQTTIGGNVLTGKTSFQLDFGMDVQVESSDSEIWPTAVSIRSIRPVLRLSGIDIAWLAAATIPLLGKAAVQTNTETFLRKRLLGGAFVLDATAEHISIKAAGLATIETPQDASGNDPSTCSLVMPCYDDGTNAVLEIDPAIAITPT